MSPELNFAHAITRMAAERGEQTALIMAKGAGWESITFAELAAQTDAIAHGFVEAGLKPGDRVLMMVKPGFDFFAISFATWKIGCVPVLVDPGMGIPGFLACIEQVAPRVLIGIPLAMFLSRVKGKAFSSVETRINVGPMSWLFGATGVDSLRRPDAGPFLAAAVDDDTEAAILFTSGSTGPAKGVQYTHGMFRTQARLIQQQYGIEAGQTDVPCFLPFAMFTMTMGMTVVLPDIDFAKPATATPEALVKAVTEHQADSLVGSPAVMHRLAAQAETVRMPTLKRVLTFGAPIPPRLHEAFKSILSDGVEIHTPYGATEALPIATIGSEEVLAGTGALTMAGKGTCVGGLYPDIEVAIIPVSDEDIAEWDPSRALGPGEIGEICVKGPQVSREYKERPDATRNSKIADGDGFWHRMGDVGYRDEQGRIWFCGRKSHRVLLTGGGALFPVPVEGIFNAMDGVVRAAVVGVSGAPVLIIEGDESARPAIEAACTGAAESIETVLFHPAFPVDRRHNAKIHRGELSRWAATKLGGEPTTAAAKAAPSSTGSHV